MKKWLWLLLFLAPCVQAQDFIQNYSFVKTGPQGPAASFANTGVNSFAIFWNPAVTIFTCSVQVDSSADGISWGNGDLIAPQNCAIAGSVPAAVIAGGKNYVRVNMTALTGNGGVSITLKGWGGAGGGGGGSGTVTHTAGNLNANQIMVGNGGADSKVSDLTGDATTSGTTATTVVATHLTVPMPAAQGGTGLASGTSGGIPCWTASTTFAASTALNINVLPMGGGAGACPTNSHESEASGIFNSTLPLSSGTVPSGITSSASGGFGCTEATGTGWTPTAGTDYIRCDSTNHAVLGSYNASTEEIIPLIHGTITSGHCTSWFSAFEIQDAGACGGSGSGTVTSFSAGNLSPLFTTSVATPTTTPALSFSLSNAAANTVFGNPTTSSSAPIFTANPAVTSIATGSSPPTCGIGIGTAGIDCKGEGTAPTSAFATGVDVGWADSTNHCDHANWNNVDKGCLAAVAATNHFTGANTEAQLNNVITVDGTTYTTIQACVNAAAALTPPGKCYVPTGTTTQASPPNATCTPSTLGVGNLPCQVLMPSNVTLEFGPGTFVNVGTTAGEFIVMPKGVTNAVVKGQGRGTTILANNITGSQFTAVYFDAGTQNTLEDITLDSGVNTVQIQSISGNGTTATVTCGTPYYTMTCGFANGQSIFIEQSTVASGSSFNGGPFTVASTSGSTLTYSSAVSNTAQGGLMANAGNSTSTAMFRAATNPRILNVELKHGIVPGGVGNYNLDFGGGFGPDVNDVDMIGGVLDCFSQATNDGSGTYGSITGGKFQHFSCHDSPSNGIDSRASGGLTIATSPTGAVENSAATQATITTTAALSTVNLGPGMMVHIAGVTNTAFNGDFIIQSSSGSAFTVNNTAPAANATSGSGQVGLEIANQTWSNITTRNNGFKNTGTDDEYGGTFIGTLAADSSAVSGITVYNWMSFNNYGSGLRLKGDVHDSTFHLNSFQNGFGTAGTVIRDAIALVTASGTSVPHNNIIDATARKGGGTNAFSTDANTYNNTGQIIVAQDAAGTSDPISLGNANDGFQFLNSPSGANGVQSVGALNLSLNQLGFDLGQSSLYARSGTTGLTTGGDFNLLGVERFTESAAPSGVAAKDIIWADSTAHELKANLINGGAGLLHMTRPAPINQTAKTAAIATATLCAASAGNCNIAGQYRVEFNFWESGTSCSSVGSATTNFQLTWTDENGTAHSAVAVPMITNASGTALSTSFIPTASALTAWSSGSLIISTNGSIIQYATAYTNCTTGTFTYNLRASVTRVQ